MADAGVEGRAEFGTGRQFLAILVEHFGHERALQARVALRKLSTFRHSKSSVVAYLENSTATSSLLFVSSSFAMYSNR